MFIVVLYNLSVLCIIFYIFSLIGQMFFGGKVYKDVYIDNTNVPSQYYLLSFNDF